MERISSATARSAEPLTESDPPEVPHGSHGLSPKALRQDLTDPVSDRELNGVIKSAKRVLELFDFFAECRRPLAVSDVVKGLNYPQSSASVLLKSLTKLGYLDYNRHTRLYIPTLRVVLFGGWVTDELYTQVHLSRLLDELHRQSGGETIILGMQNDIYVQYIHMIQSPRPEFPWYIKPGSLRPLARSGVGRVLLARKSDVEVQQLLWRINADTEPAHRMSMTDLLYELNLVRARGYAYTEGSVNVGSGVVAVEMPTPPSQPPMAIGIGASVEKLRDSRDHLLELLNTTLEPYRAQLASSRFRSTT